MKTHQELIATALLALLAFNTQGEWGRTERRAMFRAVFKTILSLI